MAMLKNLFPFAFLQKKDVITLVIYIVAHLVIGTVAGWVFGLLDGIILVGWIFSLIGWVFGIYVTVSLVLCVLDYLKVLK